MRFEVLLVLWDLTDQLIYIGIFLIVVTLNEHLFGQLGDLQEGFTSHILDAWVSLMHELVELFHYSLQESPVRAQESRELPHYVHYISCN